eukprot:g8889.t1
MGEGRVDSKMAVATPEKAEKTAAGKKKTSVNSTPGKAAADPLVAKRKEQVVAVAEMQALSKVKPYIVQYADQIAFGAVMLETKAIPAALQAVEYGKIVCKKLEPHFKGEAGAELLPMLFGFILCFFGGTFPLLIAAFEAFKLAGWDTMSKALTDLYAEGEVAVEAHKKDEQEAMNQPAVEDRERDQLGHGVGLGAWVGSGRAIEDLDGDGIPDSQQITPQELVTRKALLVARVVNPEKVSAAVTALSAGAFAVLASLKLSFARAITLGATLGQVLQKQAERTIYAAEKGFLPSSKPPAKQTVPQEYHKWLPVIFSWVTKFIAVWVAFMLQTVISAFHSAIRGGQLFGVNLVRYLNRIGKIDFNEDDSLIDEFAGYGAAGCGFLFQFYMGFSLPFPLWIVMLPLSIAEYSLGVAVSWF